MTLNRIAILGSETGWYFKKLANAAESLGINVEHVAFANLAIGSRHRSRNLQENKDLFQKEFDTAIVRTMPLGSLEQVIFRMDVLRCWENEGNRVINSSFCLETCIDKWLSLELFLNNNIPVPLTYVCQTAEQAFEAFEHLNHDVVVKPIFGGEGRGILRVVEPEMAHRVFHSLERTQSVIYCQQFVKDIAKDIRILFVGNKHFSIVRENKNSWKSNASLGGTGTSYQPTDEEYAIALAARNAVDGTVVGVDILLDKEGRYYVLEVNAVPGWQLLQKSTEIDIAKEVILSVAQESKS